MAKLRIRPIEVMYWIALIAADILFFMILGLLFMGYDDNYDRSKGEYWSLGSMNTSEKIVFLTYILWGVFNITIVFSICYKIYKRIKLKF